MALQDGKPGDYVDGRFLPPEGELLSSTNPAHGERVVFTTGSNPERVGHAVEAARRAQPAWNALGLARRFEALAHFRSSIEANKEVLADAIVQEIGKLRSEARLEVGSLIGRFALSLDRIENDLRDGTLPGFPAESLRWQPHGVVGVIGPFNFPLHLSHAHIVPALLLGNTVVLKPSEVAPYCAVLYAQAAREAGLPAGVLNVVQGRGPTGMALTVHPDVKAIAFTGSWPVGRKILEATLDKPETLLALEMGGKNVSIVCEDADLRQAAHEIVIGGYLTTGQRCTCTDRVLVHKSVARALIDALRPLVASLRFGDPDDPSAFAGPMATESGLIKLERAMDTVRAAGADPVVPGQRLPGGSFRTGSLHVLPAGLHDVPGYTDVELFGPDLGLEIVDSDEEAIGIVGGSPYGFACSVFTASDSRFDRYRSGIRLGLINRNRSTNQASPRLPFGGTGRSGNFRPAGAFASRNLAVPVAVQTNVPGAFPMHAQLREHLPPPDLDHLELRHAQEESAEAQRSLASTPRPQGIRRPKHGALPRSTEWLERLYAGDRIVRDKKPLVVDHLRSSGPYLVSVDEPPLSVLDGMSQTATSPFGFNSDALTKHYVDGAFGDAMVRAHDLTEDGPGQALAAQYAAVLRERVPGLPTVSFTGCGAEANEKAYALARQHGPKGAKKLLAFEGSFHGRTMLALYASSNPDKRVPFEIEGYQAVYSPWPLWHPEAGDRVGPEAPEGLHRLCAAADLEGLDALAQASDDPLLRSEIDSLTHVGRLLRTQEIFALVIEPMQSEGGDRYATPRFHRALRLLTRALAVPHLMDEVQCGFGLGGPFAWHQSFGLIDASGGPDVPDCVIFAKRAQLGVVMSRYPDLEPSQAFAASLVRGRLHAELFETSEADRVEALLLGLLPDLRGRWSHLISHPRAQGFALAFELPSPALLAAYLGQRFWRGAVVFAAGDRTVRYRLSAAFSARDVERLVQTIHQSLAWLEAHPGQKPPEWEDLETPHARPLRNVVVRLAAPEEADAAVLAIMAMEERIYEPARRDSDARLRLAFAEDGIAILAEELLDGGSRSLVGYALATPLEAVADVSGPDQDPSLGKSDSLYSLALTVDASHQGTGLGLRLKTAQIEAARALKTDAGAPRYRWITGRNREGHTAAMSRINDALGAFTVTRLTQQYGEDGVARYYRQPITVVRADAIDGPETANAGTIDCATSLTAPFSAPPDSLFDAERAGLLVGPTLQKLTLSNYVTPAVVRASEWAAALAPDLPHLFFTSGRDELIDKAVRMLRWHRKGGRKVLSLAGTYVGHTTAAARSISDPSLHRQGAAYFDWPAVPHPELVGVDASIDAIRDAIDAAGGPEAILGIVLESVGERSGLVASDAFLDALGTLRAETKIPVVLIETASAYYRSGRGAFHSSSVRSFLPDMLGWWTGGQHGFLHVSAPLFVTNPLTFVSTWDGDELSMIQAHHQLRSARNVEVAPLGAALEKALMRSGLPMHGAGLYRVLDGGEQAEAIAARLLAQGIRAKRYPGGRIAIAPPLDRATEAIERLGDVFG
jgi:acyl-CoA reductase-like NAD-dependent aldehyde dehydrogenase/4-aminobutyrate aminotransferase-like enzyme/GNAT superfamily N-acetyltransferase